MRRTLLSKAQVCWLDLRGSSLSVLERLCLEECILQTEDPARNWLMAGTHDSSPHKLLSRSSSSSNATIVLGIGGKPHELLDEESVQRDRIPTLKRFSGGGTVILDHNSIWTTMIGRRQDLIQEKFPRPIMDLTAERLFGPMFDRLERRSSSKPVVVRKSLVVDQTSCSPTENSGRTVPVPTTTTTAKRSTECIDFPRFALRENDYVLGDLKMGGNAQTIGKTGWLHHTSFLWDYEVNNMKYLTLPSKRPDYRQSRSHEDFLVRLSQVYPNLNKSDFFTALSETVRDEFDVIDVTHREALEIVHAQGGMGEWLEKRSRIKLLDNV